jgi:hypothetical protein
MKKPKDSVSVEFIQDHVFFCYGKRLFATSNQMRNNDGEYMERRRYNIPLSYYKDFVKKKLIKKLDVDPTAPKKTTKKTTKKK